MEQNNQIDTLNQQARIKFEEIKLKLKINAQSKVIKKTAVNVEKLQKLLDESTLDSRSAKESGDRIKAEFQHANNTIDACERRIDSIMTFISGLDLPPNLSIAMGYIIAAADNSSTTNLHEAGLCLQKQAREWE